ncbi:MAG: hypothetical protein L6V81_01245 [Clostridium sp.]|nr:MAG: hypothetical protein L6V81_01245 [Clostridium sp.]
MYKKMKKKFESMCRELNLHEREHSEEYYYKIRNLDRDKKRSINSNGKKRGNVKRSNYNKLY